MGWSLVGGAAGALTGWGEDRASNYDVEDQYTADRNSANKQYASDQTAEGRYRAGVNNYREDAQWQQDNQNAQNRSQASQNMYQTKYSIVNAQQNYDKLQSEFGDMANNIKGHFQSMSPSSIKAQNNDRFNAAMQGQLQSTEQNLAEQGINAGSGFSAALQGMIRAQTATAKVQTNRNVETEVAQAQQGFLNSAVTNPLYGSRPADFDAGILTSGELDQFNFTNKNQLNDVDAEGYDVYKAEVEKGKKRTGGGLLGGLGGLF